MAKGRLGGRGAPINQGKTTSECNRLDLALNFLRGIESENFRRRPGNFCRSCYIPLSSSRRKLFMLDKIAARAQRASGYTELRWHGNYSVQMSMRKGTLMANTRSQSRGLSARIYHNTGFGFAALPGDDDDTISAVLAQAADNAALLRQTAEPGVLAHALSRQRYLRLS